MTSEQFKAAFDQTGMTVEQFAKVIEVDPKTVRRWISGQTPYPRHRAAIARALNTPGYLLWPDDVAPPVAVSPPVQTGGEAERADVDEVVRSWGGSQDPDTPEVREMFSRPREQIDVLEIGTGILTMPAMIPALIRYADHGTQIRVLVPVDHDHLGALAGHPNIEIRARDGLLVHALIRADQIMVLQITLAGHNASPTLHIQRRRDHGLYDRTLEHFNVL